MLKVLDLKTKTERIVTPKAYSILKNKRYKLLADLGDVETEPIPESKSGRLPNVSAQLHQRPKAMGQPVAENVVSEVVGIQVNPVLSDEQTDDFDSFPNESGETEVVKKKPGRKPKANA